MVRLVGLEGGLALPTTPEVINGSEPWLYPHASKLLERRVRLFNDTAEQRARGGSCILTHETGRAAFGVFKVGGRYEAVVAQVPLDPSDPTLLVEVHMSLIEAPQPGYAGHDPAARCADNRCFSLCLSGRTLTVVYGDGRGTIDTVLPTSQLEAELVAAVSHLDNLLQCLPMQDPLSTSGKEAQAYICADIVPGHANLTPGAAEAYGALLDHWLGNS